METKGQTEARGAVLQKLLKNRLVLLLLAAGLLLLLLPSGGGTKKTGDAKLTEPAFSVTDEEARLADALGQISGVGRVKVLLSVEGSAQRQLAQSEEKTLVVSENGNESVVDLHYVNQNIGERWSSARARTMRRQNSRCSPLLRPTRG